MSRQVDFDDTPIGEFAGLVYNLPHDADGNPSSLGVDFRLKVNNANVKVIEDMNNNKTTIDSTMIYIRPSFIKLAKGVFLQQFELDCDPHTPDGIKTATFYGKFL